MAIGFYPIAPWRQVSNSSLLGDRFPPRRSLACLHPPATRARTRKLCMHVLQGCWSAGWKHGWMDGWADEWTVGWMRGWMDKQDVACKEARLHEWQAVCTCTNIRAMSPHLLLPYGIVVWVEVNLDHLQDGLAAPLGVLAREVELLESLTRVVGVAAVHALRVCGRGRMRHHRRGLG
eukprot:365417-Chlamydomonas_euryale.AAC.2